MASLPPRSVNVDTPEKPRRRWWRKKRWIAFVSLWILLPVLYPLALGPLKYAAVRRWVSGPTYKAAERPMLRAIMAVPRSPSRDAVLDLYIDHGRWWRDLAIGDGDPPAPKPN